MNETERINNINANSVGHLEDFLKQLENEEMTEDQMLSIAYAAMVTVSILGFSAEEIAKSAVAAADKLMDALVNDITNNELTNPAE